jgi:hypothetical protein
MTIQHGPALSQPPVGGPQTPVDLTRYLVVANQTAASSRLRESLRTHAAFGPARWYLLVPATELREQDRRYVGSEHLRAWPGEDLGFALARLRLAHAVQRLAEDGITVIGEIGAPAPVVAVREFLAGTEVDHILVSTLPRRSSRWLEAGLPRRLRRTTGLPVTHVEATDVR